MHDGALCGTLAKSRCSLPKLVFISLRGVYRLTDAGLRALAGSAKALEYVNISESNLVTSDEVVSLIRRLHLRELYIDHCQNINAVAIFPALRKLKCLEVLSVAGLQSVCDDFVHVLAKSCGKRLKELILADYVALTDTAIKSLGIYCPGLRGLDISRTNKLTDMSILHLTNDCQSLRSLKLCRNTFSDEGIAAFLEVSGSSLIELSLNDIKRVGENTALSIVNCSKNLVCLDLSWCRGVTDEVMGYTFDKCSSLRLLKISGCSQLTEVFVKGR